MEKVPLHIGMRNVKTALAVFVCLLLYRLLGRDSYFLAVVSAIICMQDTVEKSVSSGLNRCAGTAIGAVLGTALLFVEGFIPYDITMVLAALGVILLIALCNVLRKPETIVIGCVVFLTIVLEQTMQHPLLFGANRLLDTFMGIVVAVLINRFIRNPDNRAKKAENAQEPVQNTPTEPQPAENGEPTQK